MYCQSQNTLDTGMAQEYMSYVSEEIQGMVTKKIQPDGVTHFECFV